jgi:hypothetical protein
LEKRRLNVNVIEKPTVEEHKDECSISVSVLSGEGVKYNNEVDPKTSLNVKPSDQPPDFSNSPEKGYACSKCSWVGKHLCHLYGHYSIVHFRKQILERCGRKPQKCPVCGTWKNKTVAAFLRHLGVTHRLVELFLEPQFHAASLTRKKNEALNHFYSSERFPCVFGCLTTKTPSTLYHHYSVAHFREQILEEFGSKNLKCRLCDKQCRSEEKFLHHVGVAH